MGGSTLNKAEYISIALHSGLAEIDAACEQWLCIRHTHTHTSECTLLAPVVLRDNGD